MKWQTVVASAALVLVGVGAGAAPEAQAVGKAADAPVVKKQTLCPIMGGKVNASVFADHDGKRVYFCCNGCPAEFKKAPAKYIAKLEKEGVTLDRTPTAATTGKQATNAPGTATAAGQDAAAGNVGGGHCK